VCTSVKYVDIVCTVINNMIYNISYASCLCIFLSIQTGVNDERSPMFTSKTQAFGDGRIIVMTRYIENIDLSFSISIYRIVLYCRKNIEFLDMLQYLLYIMIFSKYCNILRQRFIFLLLHYKITRINGENDTSAYSSFSSSLTHSSIYVKQTALLNVHVLFLCLYKFYIFIVLKILILISWYF